MSSWNFSDVRDMCGSFLACGRGAACAQRRRYAGWQLERTSTDRDAAVERTVNAVVLQVAQTTSIRWVSGCWVYACRVKPRPVVRMVPSPVCRAVSVGPPAVIAWARGALDEAGQYGPAPGPPRCRTPPPPSPRPAAVADDAHVPAAGQKS